MFEPVLGVHHHGSFRRSHFGTSRGSAIDSAICQVSANGIRGREDVVGPGLDALRKRTGALQLALGFRVEQTKVAHWKGHVGTAAGRFDSFQLTIEGAGGVGGEGWLSVGKKGIRGIGYKGKNAKDGDGSSDCAGKRYDLTHVVLVLVLGR